MNPHYYNIYIAWFKEYELILGLIVVLGLALIGLGTIGYFLTNFTGIREIMELD